MSSKPSCAFDVLKSAGKKRSHPSQGADKEGDAPRKKHEKAHGSSFQPCPVCNRAIASALLAFHVNSCLEASSSRSQAVQGKATPQLHQEHVTVAADASRTEAPRSLAQNSSGASEGQTAGTLDAKALEKGQSVSHLDSVRTGERDSSSRLSGSHWLPPEDKHSRASPPQQIASTATNHAGDPWQIKQADGKAMVQQHKAEAPNVEGNAHNQQSRTKHALLQEQARLEPENQILFNDLQAAERAQQSDAQQKQAKPEVADVEAAQRSVPAAGNAFAHMMNKQKERAQTWTFYLGRAEDGRLFWHMWRDVKGTAAVPEIITHCSGHKVVVNAPDGATVQRCKQQIVWSAESQASLADLECRVEEATDRAAAGKVTLRLCTNIEPRHGGRLDVGSLLWKSGTAGRPWEYTGAASLLKSALQKNIRRGRAEAAVRCAQRLLQSEPGELLRRACVISVEDALLHPQLPMLAFLMAATAKGYALGRTLASACLRIIHDLAVVPVQDRAPKGEGQSYSCSSPETNQLNLALDEAGGSLIRGLLMRAAYGGLQGDVAMLRRFSLLWLARLTGVAPPAPKLISQGGRSADQVNRSWPAYLEASFAEAQMPGMVVEWGTLGRLKPDDIPAAAVDFHISSIIEDLLCKANILAAATDVAAKTGCDPAAALKSAMWRFSGSCNHRSLPQGCVKDRMDSFDGKIETLKLLWDAAQPAADAWAQQYIKTRFRPA